MLAILSIYALLLFQGAHAALGNSAGKLGSYNIDESAISVSGLSSGGFMAAQIHVCESETFMGVGIIAGGPYNCADGKLGTALGACMSTPSMINVNNLVQNAKNQASANNIDSLDNLLNTKVYLYSGTDDTTVDPGVVDKTEQFYNSLNVKSENVLFKNDIDSVHGFPTMDYGTACDRTNRQEYINDCNYDSAYELLNHIYDSTITRPSSYTATPAGSLLTFDQTEFIDGASASSISMDDTGYVFVPDSCADGTKTCKLHISFHGCQQGKSYIGDSYAVHTGYNRVAALNDIIVLQPQAIAIPITNPNGCWDFWAYTDANYDFHSGKQIKTVMEMVNRLKSGSTGANTNPPTPITTTEPTTDKSTSPTTTTKTTTSSSGGNEVLGSYGADNSAISVSGIGSGGFMAVQVHVAESDRIIGAGAVEGGPYYCAEDNVITATSSCMYAPYAINLNSLYSDAEDYAANGDIASLNNLQNSKVYLYSGTKDLTVSSGVVEKAETFYANYDADISSEYSISSRDAFPTVNKGGPCGTISDDDLNSCNFPGAYNILNHIYGGSLKMPDYTSDAELDGELFQFNQNDAIGSIQTSDIGLSDYGMAFVPTTCSQGQISCRVHVAFHGCKSGDDSIATEFATNAGYNEVATLNDIILIYPRTKINLLSNPQDCWDWWGYTDNNYATSKGVQIQAIMAMVDLVTA